MTPYIFFRSEGFYPVEYPDDDSARLGAFQNPGTKLVFNPLTNRPVWNDGDPDNDQHIQTLKKGSSQ